jgi:hypothetical protein
MVIFHARNKLFIAHRLSTEKEGERQGKSLNEGLFFFYVKKVMKRAKENYPQSATSL